MTELLVSSINVCDVKAKVMEPKTIYSVIMPKGVSEEIQHWN